MTDRVLRLLSVVSLVLLALDATWNLITLPTFVVHLPLVTSIDPEYILGYLVLPTTATSIGEVTGVVTLVVSLQRRQWGWFSAALACLVAYSYAGLALDFPASITFLYKLTGEGGTYFLRAGVTLYYVLVLMPLVVLATVYAWTRRKPAIASTAT
jgi:hypothetical protein